MKAIIILLVILLIAGCESEVVEETTELHDQQTEISEEVEQETASGDNSQEESKQEGPVKEQIAMGGITGAVIGIAPQEEEHECNLELYFTCVDQNNDQCYADCPLEMVPCPPGNYATAGCFDFDPDCIAACDGSVSQDCMDSSGCTPDDL